MRQFVLLWVLWLAGWVSFLSGLVLNEVNFSTFDGPHYSLAFDEAPIPYSSAIGGDKVRIKSKEGFDYSCLIPAAKPPPKPKEEKKEETPNVAELLEPLRQYCLQLKQGWWTYEYCHGKSLLQYHDEPDKMKPRVEYKLGDFMKSESLVSQHNANTNVNANQNEGYVSQQLKHGTICDLTGRHRETEVRFACNLQTVEQISLVKEISTCKYLVIINTPRLCKPGVSENAHSQEITCRPIITDEKFIELVSGMDEKLFCKSHPSKSSGEELAEVLASSKRLPLKIHFFEDSDLKKPPLVVKDDLVTTKESSISKKDPSKLTSDELTQIVNQFWKSLNKQGEIDRSQIKVLILEDLPSEDDELKDLLTLRNPVTSELLRKETEFDDHDDDNEEVEEDEDEDETQGEHQRNLEFEGEEKDNVAEEEWELEIEVELKLEEHENQ